MTEPAALTPAALPQARRLARLVAIQGLYQITLTQEEPEPLIRRLKANPSIFLQEEASSMEVDQELCSAIIAGVCKHIEDLDTMLSGATDARLSSARMEPLLKAILRAGIYELQHAPMTPTGVIINDYVDVAHSFFDAKEPGLVNAILDKLARTLRS